MPIIKKNNASVFTSFILKLDEFLPVVRFLKETHATQKAVHAGAKPGKEYITLSKYLDEDKRKIKVFEITSEKRDFHLHFKVEKGGSSLDNYGYIQAKLSTQNQKIKIQGKNTFNVKYDSEFDLKIKVEENRKVDFYLDFYANDDNDFNKGEYKDLHCGRVKIIFDWCSLHTDDWDAINSIIPYQKFVRYGQSGIEENCFEYAKEQLRVMGYRMKSESWLDWGKTSPGHPVKSADVYQLYLDTDVAGMKKGVQKQEFDAGVNYLKETLKKGIPVVVGVDNDYATYNSDLTTEHFVTIVGMGEESDGRRFFLFYDNASFFTSIGTSLDNKLYCDCEKCLISGTGDESNTYITRSKKKKYIVAHIRKTHETKIQ